MGVRKALERLAFGPARFPQQCAIGLRDPQPEVSVWLHGIGAPRDVTSCNVMAAARPLTIGVGLTETCDVGAIARVRPSLKFYQRGGENQVLGEISLSLKDVIPAGDARLYLFEFLHSKNYCLPKGRLWLRYLQYAVRQWRRSVSASTASNFKMVTRELHGVFVFYICPRPVVLVSAVDAGLANIFPMDLIGAIGDHFSLALHSTSTAVPLMERSRKIALTSVPVDQAAVAIQLGQNHNKPSIDCNHVPFALTTSPLFGLPAPEFALRVREMQIEAVRTVGSHKLFLASTVSDQQRGEGLQLFFIHGFYQTWRVQHRFPDLMISG
jgi:flavin reductase (DIM6/NTAB) family NADH-FMN oxidoreductase RutF